MIVSLHKVTKIFDSKTVLRDQDLLLRPGDFVSILGPSGCGKTTLLRMIAGLEKPTSGELISTLQKREMGYVFQEPHLLPWKSVYENIALPLRLKKQKILRGEIEGVLSKVGLLQFRDLLPYALSGGMKMRTSLARALATSPKLLLMDEPFAALDELIRFRLEEELREIWSKEKMTILFVTHSLTEAVFLSNRCLVFSGKQLVEIPILLPEKRNSQTRKLESFSEAIEKISSELERA